MDEILTAEQVANILQVHPFTVLKFIKQGKLKASKLGRVYRIRRSDIDEFLDNQVQQSQTVKPDRQTDGSKGGQKKSKESNSNGKKPVRNARKDQKTPRSETNKVEPQAEVPTKEMPEKKDSPQRSDKNDLDHYKLKI